MYDTNVEVKGKGGEGGGKDGLHHSSSKLSILRLPHKDDKRQS